MPDLPADPELVARYYRRRMPWALAITFGGMVLAAGPWDGIKWVRSLASGLGIIGSTAVLMVPLAIWFTVVITWERRLVRRVRKAEYRLCPQCGYSLVGRKGSIACPECGRPCEMNDVELMWRAFRPRISEIVVRDQWSVIPPTDN